MHQEGSTPDGAHLRDGDKPSTLDLSNATAWFATTTMRLDRYGALSDQSSKTFCCPASPSARRTASWKSLNEYRPIAGGISAPFDNMVRRRLVAAGSSGSFSHSGHLYGVPSYSLPR